MPQFRFIIRSLWLCYLFKLGIFLGRVGVVKAHDEFALEAGLVVLVQEGCLGMTHMQKPRAYYQQGEPVFI